MTATDVPVKIENGAVELRTTEVGDMTISPTDAFDAVVRHLQGGG